MKVISRTFNFNKIPKYCVDICRQLDHKGFDVWIVGGSIRDLLLAKIPNDFDIVTNAKPKQIYNIFPQQCQIIGKRFQVCHLSTGKGKPIEVATLRKNKDNKIITSQSGRILKDNTFGHSVLEDAKRRDFTINALYYSVKNDNILDAVGGIGDIKLRKLKVIGKSHKRFIEDPIRILRAIRFKSKFQLQILPQDEQNMVNFSDHLNFIPAARKMDELLKFFFNGSAFNNFNELLNYNCLQYFFPAVEQLLESNSSNKKQYYGFINKVLNNTDIRYNEEKLLSPAFLIASLLWSAIDNQMSVLKINNDNKSLSLLFKQLIEEQNKVTRIPYRWQLKIIDILNLQLILKSNQSIKSTKKILSYPNFKAGYDLFYLRSYFESNLNTIIKYWTKQLSEIQK